MIDWLSTYNYDYEIASIPIQLIIIVFYFSHKNLPIRKTRVFFTVLFSNLVMTCADIISCEMNVLHKEISLPFLYGINILYFIMFFVRNWALYEYTAEECKIRKISPGFMFYLMTIPLIITILVTLSTPFTHWIFYFNSTGYHNSVIYSILYTTSWFYRITSVFVILVMVKRNQMSTSISLIAVNSVLMIGLVLRKSFASTLIMSYFSVISLLIIYLASQNPDLFRVRKIDLFSDEAFSKIVPDLIRKKRPFECLCICIQNFATVNTLYNSYNVNLVLGQVGKWLLRQFPHCTIFYFREGQFIILNAHNKYALQDRIDIITDRFSKPWKYKDFEISFTITFAYMPKELTMDSVSTAFECLELGMSECSLPFKTPNSVVTINESYLEKVHRTEQVARAIGKAIKNRSLMIYLQPLYSSKEQRVTAAEALARLHDDELGFIPPNEFIAIAENNGQIIELGRQIFDETCKFISEHDLDAMGIDFINVNLSPTQCMNENLADDLLATIYKYNIPTSRINLEITESSIDDIGTIRKQMERLSNMGLRFSMDDFGSGTSNVSRLVELPFTIVKLDMALVWSYFRGTSKILKSQIEMFLNEQMKIVAEGVEDEHMANELVSLGCEYAQGYYYSKPLPINEFIEYMNSNSHVNKTK